MDQFYTSFKKNLLDNPPVVPTDGIDFLSNPIQVALIAESLYTFNPAHTHYSDVAAAVVGTPQTITHPTIGISAVGVFDGDDLVFPAVSGPKVRWILMYQANAGANTTWPLIALLDQVGNAGLPFIPNGSNIEITWNVTGILGIA